MIAFLPIDLLSLKALLLLAGWIVFFVVGNYGLYFLLSLPMRRQERARLFLDLLDHALANGRPLEEAIQSVGRCRDRALGARFHLLAAHMERGLNFEQALAKVPTLLPPVVTEMLRLGREAGDLRRVLPACQRMIRDHASQVRKAQSYVIVLLLVVSPVALTVLGFLRVYVFPKFEAIFADMLERTPQEFNLLVAYEPLWLAGYVFFCGLIWTGTFLYLGGPRADRMLHAMFGNLYDAFLLRLPWRRQRVQRDFAAMLGVLLDAGLPESQAVTRAAAATANAAFARRAEHVVNDLQAGVKLTEAVRHLDDAGEFHWRLANAAQGKARFGEALAGWQESLDARAFQQEQSFTHLITTGLVFWNGLLVAAVCWCIFKFITDLIWEGTMW